MVAINKLKALSLEQIKSLWIVYPETGEIYWRERGFGRTLGKPCGCLVANGHRKIGLRINGKYIQFYAHHIVWAWCHGSWPIGDLDHKNGNPDDNRIDNLRPASDEENAFNKGRVRTNKSGLKWVCLHKSSAERGKPKPWQAAVWAGEDRRQKYFASKEEAFAWASNVAQELHGEFYNSG